MPQAVTPKRRGSKVKRRGERRAKGWGSVLFSPLLLLDPFFCGPVEPKGHRKGERPGRLRGSSWFPLQEVQGLNDPDIAATAQVSVEKGLMGGAVDDENSLARVTG